MFVAKSSATCSTHVGRSRAQSQPSMDLFSIYHQWHHIRHVVWQVCKMRGEGGTPPSCGGGVMCYLQQVLPFSFLYFRYRACKPVPLL